MQNKLHIIFLTTQKPIQPFPEQRSWNLETVNFTKLPKIFELLDKFKLTENGGFKLTVKRNIPAPPANPIHKQSTTSMVWNISTGQLGYLSGCAPSQLLHTCS